MLPGSGEPAVDEHHVEEMQMYRAKLNKWSSSAGPPLAFRMQFAASVACLHCLALEEGVRTRPVLHKAEMLGVSRCLSLRMFQESQGKSDFVNSCGSALT